MDKELFTDLLTSEKEMQEIRAGKRKPGRVTPELLRSLIAEGLASGPAIEVTPAYWAAKRKKLGV